MRYAIHAPACFSKPPSHTQSERPSLRSGPALCPGQAYFLLSPGQYESNWQSRQVSSCLNIELAQMHWSRDVAPGSERLFAVQGCMSLCPGHRTDVQDRAKCTPAHVPGSAEGARKRGSVLAVVVEKPGMAHARTVADDKTSAFPTSC